MHLRWRDIDLDRGLAILHDTKNGERRSLPLEGEALRLLQDRSVGRDPDEPAFGGRRGAVTFPKTRWDEAVTKAGIENFRFHDLRHTAASYLAMSGATLAEIAEILGHKTLAMVKRYAHLSDRHTSRVVARMNEKYLPSSRNDSADGPRATR